jgi:integrase
MKYFTDSQMADILNIHNNALLELVNRDLIPYSKIYTNNGLEIRFLPQAIENWLKENPKIMPDNKITEDYKKDFRCKYPNQLRILYEYNKKFKDPRRGKGYNLAKVPNKKMGFVYYARYIVDGKLVPSRWCTHTSDPAAAARWAIENKNRLLKNYYERRIIKKPTIELYTVFKNFYKDNSIYLTTLAKRKQAICERARCNRYNFIIHTFLPYLRKNRIRYFTEIDTPFLVRFQNYLLNNQSLMPQTVNIYTSHIKVIFDYLLLEGYTQNNPCNNMTRLSVLEQHPPGCYDIGEIKGVFNKKWNSDLYYMLCLLIYTTNMRNSEIERIRLTDIIQIDKYHFIDIKESKTKNGIRIVPLHNFVYNRLTDFINKMNKKDNDYIFTSRGKHLGGSIYQNATLELAQHLGWSVDMVKKENIKFYSGRHFWKTLMNSENLGDIEEYLMGHKVNSDIANRYNHRDKHGKDKLYDKIDKLFGILDKYVFK